MNSENIVNFKERAADIRNNVFLSFKEDEKKEVEITFSDATMSIIGFGATGSGKTTAIMYPGLFKLIENKCPGLILDVKGDYVDFCRQNIPDDDLAVIGVSRGSIKCNILEGISEEVFRGFIHKLSVHSTGKDGFWGVNAVRDATMLYAYYIETRGRTITLAELYEHLDSPQDIVDEINGWISSRKEINERLYKMINTCKNEKFGIFEIAHDAIMGVNVTNAEQYAWHTLKLKDELRPFFDNELLKEYLSNTTNEVASIKELIYEKNKTIVVDIPQTMFGSAGVFICRLLRERFFNAVFSTNQEYRKSKGIGVSKFTFLFIDEYQNYINAEAGSNKHGLIDDNTWIDKSRAYGHINLFAAQGMSSLMAQVESKTVADSILQNIRTKLFLQTDDELTLNFLISRLNNRDFVLEHVLMAKKRGSLMVYKGVHPKIGFYCCTTAESKFLHMNRFINAPIKNSSVYEKIPGKTIANNGFKKENGANDVIFVFHHKCNNAKKVFFKYWSTDRQNEKISMNKVHFFKIKDELESLGLANQIIDCINDLKEPSIFIVTGEDSCIFDENIEKLLQIAKKSKKISAAALLDNSDKHFININHV